MILQAARMKRAARASDIGKPPLGNREADALMERVSSDPPEAMAEIGVDGELVPVSGPLASFCDTLLKPDNVTHDASHDRLTPLQEANAVELAFMRPKRPGRRIEFRIGIHIGDVVEESDGDLMGAGVNIAARLEGIAKAGTVCLSEDAYRQVKSRLDLLVTDLGATHLKNIAEPMRVYSLQVGSAVQTEPAPAALVRRQKPPCGTCCPTATQIASRDR
jgi:hypothetical protein